MSGSSDRTSSQSSPEDPATPRRLRIFILEDEALVAMLIEDMILELGHDVAAVSSRIDEALVIARTASFDLAILDVNLNGKPSYPVADVLISRNIPFAFATGYGRQDHDARYQHVPILPKPFVGTDLAGIISELAKSGARA
ncbi:response regulator [Bosea sp. RAF48]|uniref:response regulator n=1 Tax=Bosea sp. RAF48 TaxID=3237480 RepID=UPI003F9285CD